LHDAGKSLNPLIDRGQIEGGFIQGVGWCTTEEIKWDDKGRLMTHSPDTYKNSDSAGHSTRFFVWNFYMAILILMQSDKAKR